jgi:hypothetical protein
MLYKGDKRKMGLQTEKFRNDLIALVNNCELGISTAYYVLKDVLNMTEKEYNRTLLKEQQEAVEKTEEK